MKLSTLLEQHRRHNQGASCLPDCFGDGYLVAKNRIYGRIRLAALKSGFEFSSKINAAYSSLSLSQLDAILDSKVIPYIPNAPVVESLEMRIPNQIIWDDISDNLKGTHVFHESCHAVARGFVPELAHIKEEEGRILAMLLEESFANTCELLSIIDAEDQVHRIFLELNSYIYMLDDRSGLSNAVKEFGRPVLVTFIFLSYLHSNFLRSMGEKEFDVCCRVAIAAEGKIRSLDSKQKKTLRALSKIAFELNPRFREVTTRFHFKLHGIRKSVNDLGSVQFMDLLEKSPLFSRFLSRVGEF